MKSSNTPVGVTLNSHSKRSKFEVCAHVQFVVLMLLISAQYGFLCSPQWFACINKYSSGVVLKLLSSTLITLEHSHIFSTSLIAELTIRTLQKIKERQEIHKLS